MAEEDSRGDDMLRPSPNHGTQLLPNDDDDDDFVNVVSLRYIGMIYISVGEMCFIPMNLHNELFNGVRQLRWRHLSPVVSTFSTSTRLLSSLFI